MKVELHWEYSQIWLELDKNIYTEELIDGGKLVILTPLMTKSIISSLTLALLHYEQIEQSAQDHDVYLDKEEDLTAQQEIYAKKEEEDYED